MVKIRTVKPIIYNYDCSNGFYKKYQSNFYKNHTDQIAKKI